MESHTTTLAPDVANKTPARERAVRTSSRPRARSVVSASNATGRGAGAGLVTKTLVVVPATDGHITVNDAGTSAATLSVQWGDVLMRFTSAAQVSEVLAAFGAVREAMRGVDGTFPSTSETADSWPWLSIVTVAWSRPPGWSVVSQSKYVAPQRRTVHWVDVHMGPVQWRFVDWAGYEAALSLMRNAHRAAVAVFDDGPAFLTDPSRVDVLTDAGI